MGRHPKYTTAEQLQEVIDEFFKTESRPTLSGLALALDIDRRTLYNYSQNEVFFPTIKKAREKIESLYEDKLIYGTNPTGVIFALKNFGWRDKVETGFTNSEGKDVAPQIIFQPAKNCEPINPDQEQKG